MSASEIRSTGVQKALNNSQTWAPAARLGDGNEKKRILQLPSAPCVVSALFVAGIAAAIAVNVSYMASPGSAAFCTGMAFAGATTIASACILGSKTSGQFFKRLLNNPILSHEDYEKAISNDAKFHFRIEMEKKEQMTEEQAHTCLKQKLESRYVAPFHGAALREIERERTNSTRTYELYNAAPATSDQEEQVYATITASVVKSGSSLQLSWTLKK
jgi:hypothetical protein